jgi:hypothetical protein
MYISLFFAIQYTLVVANMSDMVAPQDFPIGLKDYPKGWTNPDGTP